jgi:hypothetical protein
MRYIFLSYSRLDANKIEPLAEDMRGLGHKVWLDQELAGGMTWWSQILENIRASDVFVYAVSPNSINSQACLREFKYAVSLGKPVLPIYVDDVDVGQLPVALQSLQVIDYINPSKGTLFALIKAFLRLPEAPPLPQQLPDPPPMPATYLAELREVVEGDGFLSFEGQSSLIIKLKEELKSSVQLSAVIDVFRRLRRRKDLFAVIAEEIDTIIKRPLLKPTKLEDTEEKSSGQNESTIYLSDSDVPTNSRTLSNRNLEANARLAPFSDLTLFVFLTVVLGGVLLPSIMYRAEQEYSNWNYPFAQSHWDVQAIYAIFWCFLEALIFVALRRLFLKFSIRCIEVILSLSSAYWRGKT